MPDPWQMDWAGGQPGPAKNPWEMDWSSPAVAQTQVPEPQLAPVSGPAAGLAGASREVTAPSGMDAFARGLYQGATANFGDELAGLASAGGGLGQAASGLMPLAGPLVGAARYGYEQLTGQPGEATAGYEQARDAARAQTKEAERLYPGMTMAGNIAGAVAMPGGALVRGATMPARMATGAATGAGFGALYGAGEGETLPDRASRAATGGTLGAVAGAAAAPVLAGVEAVGGLAGRVVEPFINSMRGRAGVEREAGRRAARAIETDRRLGQGLTDAEFNAARAAGLPVTNVERGGTATGELARSASNTSLDAQAMLRQLAEDRFAGQTDRTVTFLRSLVPGLPDTEPTREALRAAARNVNRPAYRNFYAATENGMWSPELERLAGSPAVVDAMRAAVQRGKDRAIADGYGAFNPGVMVENGRIVFQRRPNGVPASPNGQFWDYTYRELRDAADEAFRRGRNSEGQALQGLTRTLRDELDRLATNAQGQSLFQEARAGAARFFGAENALDAGSEFVRNGMTAREGARAMARLSQPERDLFRQGFMVRFIDDVNNTRDRINVLGKIAQTPEARGKLELVLGQQGYRHLNAYLHVEQAIDRLRSYSMGNSTTARQLYNLGLAGGGGVGAYGGYSTDPTTIAGGLTLALLSHRGKRVDERVARRVAEMLTSNNPNIIANGVRAVANNNAMLQALRNFDASFARVGGQQTSGIPALQSLGIGRAEEDQPDVPRPSGQ